MSDRQSLHFWKYLLEEKKDLKAVPVGSFLNAALSEKWDERIKPGLIVGVANSRSGKKLEESVEFWWARVLRVEGYLVKLRYLGFDDDQEDFWLNLAFYREDQEDIYDRVFPADWASEKNKPIKPPPTLRELDIDWESFAKEQLENGHVLTQKFYDALRLENKSSVEPGMKFEVTDVEKIARLRPATVVAVVGRWVKLRYAEPSKSYCWWHDSFLYPCGWGKLHGVEVKAYDDYLLSCLENMFRSKLEPAKNEATISHVQPLLVSEFIANKLLRDQNRRGFKRGSKLECIDPMNPGFIRVGTIKEILNNHYLIISIDLEGAKHRICYHASSSYLLPAGFAQEFGLSEFFESPYKPFSWEKYLKDEKCEAVPKDFFQRPDAPHNFVRGQLLEVAGCKGFDMFYAGRVERVVNHLVRIRFDDWKPKDDVFIAISSPELNPIGFCDMNGFELITENPTKTFEKRQP